MTDVPMEAAVEVLAETLGKHRYIDTWGDYEEAPYTRQFGCTCGWEQNIAGMNGWTSWLAAHQSHVAEHLATAALPSMREVIADEVVIGFTKHLDALLDSFPDSISEEYLDGFMRAIDEIGVNLRHHITADLPAPEPERRVGHEQSPRFSMNLTPVHAAKATCGCLHPLVAGCDHDAPMQATEDVPDWDANMPPRQVDR